MDAGGGGEGSIVGEDQADVAGDLDAVRNGRIFGHHIPAGGPGRGVLRDLGVIFGGIFHSGFVDIGYGVFCRIRSGQNIAVPSGNRAFKCLAAECGGSLTRRQVEIEAGVGVRIYIIKTIGISGDGAADRLVGSDPTYTREIHRGLVDRRIAAVHRGAGHLLGIADAAAGDGDGDGDGRGTAG